MASEKKIRLLFFIKCIAARQFDIPLLSAHTEPVLLRVIHRRRTAPARHRLPESIVVLHRIHIGHKELRGIGCVGGGVLAIFRSVTTASTLPRWFVNS
jgi:hypothetical protein